MEQSDANTPRCKHPETVEQPPSIDGHVLVRCKACGVVVRSHRLREEPRRALGRARVIEELQKGAIIQVCTSRRTYYHIDQQNAPPLTVREDTAINLQRDGLLKKTGGTFALVFDLIPTDEFWARYPRKAVVGNNGQGSEGQGHA